jgi:hypothetical protein
MTMLAIRTDQNGPIVAEVVAMSDAIRLEWDAQYDRWKQTEHRPEPAVFIDNLRNMVNRAADIGPEARRALSEIYPLWMAGATATKRRSSAMAIRAFAVLAESFWAVVDCRRGGASRANRVKAMRPRLGVPVAEALLEVENRLARAFSHHNDTDAHLKALVRQAAVADHMEEGLRRVLALDTIMGALLGSGTEPRLNQGGHTWASFVRRYDALIAIPTDDEIATLPDTPDATALDAVDRLARPLAEAVDAAPPHIWALPPTFETAAYRGMQAAPVLGARLHERLWAWLEDAQFDPAAQAQLSSIASLLEGALEGWLTRSTPSDPAPGRPLNREWAGWSRHLSRSREVRAHVWRAKWYDQQAARAALIGSELLHRSKPSEKTVDQYLRFLLAQLRRDAPVPDEQAVGWYMSEALAAVGLLPEARAAEFREKLAKLEATPRRRAPVNLGSWVRGDFDANEVSARRELIAYARGCTTPLGKWVLLRAIALSEQAEPPSPPLPVDAAMLIELVVDHKARASWLAGVQNVAADGDECDELLAMLCEAVIELSGRSDSAIDIAIARRLRLAGKFEDARDRVLQVLKADRRPRTQGICRMLLGGLTLQQNPGRPRAWQEAYEHLVSSWILTRGFDKIHEESVGALQLATKVAIRAGWPASAAWCIGETRRAQTQGRLSDNQPWAGHLQRLEAFAIWAMGRPTTPRGRALRGRLLKIAVDHLSTLQLTYAERNVELVRSRHVVAMLSQTLPGSREAADLVLQTPAARLHGLAMGFQRGGRRAIEDSLLSSALARLDDTPEAATFIGGWLVKAYFDSKTFPEQLEKLFDTMRSYQYGEAAIAKLIAEAPVQMALEIATRCREAVLSMAKAGSPQAQLEAVTTLMQGVLLKGLQPRAYSGGGKLFLDDSVVRSLTNAQLLKVDVRRGLWVEALFGARALDALSSHLQLPSDGTGPAVALKRASKEHDARLTLQSAPQAMPRLTYTGTIYRSVGLAEEVWEEAAQDWVASFRRAMSKLSSRRRAVPLPYFQAVVSADRIEVQASVSLWLPPEQPPSDAARELHAMFDRDYGLHLARLSARAPGDLTCTPIPVLHDLYKDLREVAALAVEDTPRADQAPRGNARRLGARAAIHASADMIWRMVRWPETTARADVFEVLSPLAATYRMGEIPAWVREVRLAMPTPQMRLTLGILFENAWKAREYSGGPVSMEVSINEGMLRIVVLAPLIAQDVWKSFGGLGIGVATVAGYASFYGGAILQGPSEVDSVYRSELTLPLALPEQAKTDLELGL